MSAIRLNIGGRTREAPKTLSLTALIDIMTILLIFLIYNISDEAMSSIRTDDLSLPITSSGQRPDSMETMVVLAISQQSVTVDNRLVMSIAELRSAKPGTVPQIGKALEDYRAWEQEMIGRGLQDDFAGHVKILGDESLTFIDMLKVMRTCSQKGYEGIYLAAIPSH